MSTPPYRTSTDSASAWACAAMDRNPCGPPSQRHHISGESAASVRRIVCRHRRNGQGGCAGRPLTCRFRQATPPPARCPRPARARPPVQPTEERVAERRAASATGCARARQAARRAPRRSRPAGAAAPAHRRARPWHPSSRTAVSSRVAHRCARRRRLDGGEEPELGYEPVVVRGQLSVDPGRERVAVEFALEQRGDSCRHRPLSGNHGNAQLAASCPAASAITWLFAEDPLLSNAARYSWCQWICRSARSLRSKRSATPARRRAAAGSRRS